MKIVEIKKSREKIKALLVTYAASERALPHVETRLLLASLANSVTLTNSGTTRKIPARSSPNPLAVLLSDFRQEIRQR